MEHLLPIIELLEQGKIASDSAGLKVYKESYTNNDDVHLLMVKDQAEKYILATGNGSTIR